MKEKTKTYASARTLIKSYGKAINIYIICLFYRNFLPWISCTIVVGMAAHWTIWFIGKSLKTDRIVILRSEIAHNLNIVGGGGDEVTS